MNSDEIIGLTGQDNQPNVESASASPRVESGDAGARIDSGDASIRAESGEGSSRAESGEDDRLAVRPTQVHLGTADPEIGRRKWLNSLHPTRGNYTAAYMSPHNSRKDSSLTKRQVLGNFRNKID